MCLAVPAKIVALEGDRAVVELDGVRRDAIVAFIDDPRLGDFVLVHAGFAIRKWSEEDVADYRALLAELQDTAEPQSNKRPF